MKLGMNAEGSRGVKWVKRRGGLLVDDNSLVTVSLLSGDCIIPVPWSLWRYSLLVLYILLAGGVCASKGDGVN